MGDKWKFATQVFLTKDALLALDVLAKDESIQDYIERLILQHIEKRNAEKE